MHLRGIDFGHVLDASGARGFFGEGYPHHRWLGPIGLDFTGSTFVAKTTTLYPRTGNMPLRGDLSPRELLPKCIVVKPWKGIALNAVGLSGPGAKTLLDDGRWQRRTEPFFLSFMSVEESPADRSDELKAFVRLLEPRLKEFRAPVALQINVSCQNTGLHFTNLVQEIHNALEIASALRIALVPKISVATPPEDAVAAARHPACAALCITNTVLFGTMSDRIDWKKLFGSETSPLAKYGGGGLSGAPLLGLVFEWLLHARSAGLTIPVNAGGGILSPVDAGLLLAAGADSIFLGSITMLRPWRMQSVIRYANAFKK